MTSKLETIYQRYLKLTELVGTLSVVYFSPDELKLIKEVPEDRRTFLDVSISQFDKSYLYDLLKKKDYPHLSNMENSLIF
jgi:DNA replication and repair protein RecF